MHRLRVLNKRNFRVLADSSALATYTGEIFIHDASLAEDAIAVQTIERANNHLYYIRMLECQILDHVQSELACLCELLLANQCEQLMEATNAYTTGGLRCCTNCLISCIDNFRPTTLASLFVVPAPCNLVLRFMSDGLPSNTIQLSHYEVVSAFRDVATDIFAQSRTDL